MNQSLRAEFPQLKQTAHGQRLCYLDSAATTLKPPAMIDRIAKYYSEEVANVHRGAHFFADRGTTAYENARQTVADFLGAVSSAEVVFTRGTTESINLVARSYLRPRLQPGDEILISEIEHHSNIVPWQMVAEETGAKLKAVRIDKTGDLDFAHFQSLLGARTRMVSLTWVSNALGTVTDLRPFVQAAHSVGAAFCVDAAQAVSHLPISVQSLDADFLAFSGHKIFGPTGIGVLWSRLSVLEEMPPYQGGGSMIDQVTLEKTTYLPPPQRFEAGTPNISGAVGLAAALQWFQAQSPQVLEQHCNTMLESFKSFLATIPSVRVIGEPRHRAGILPFVVNGIHNGDIASLLDQEGVAVRAGHLCCQPLMARLGIPGVVRISLSAYNDREDLAQFESALVKALRVLGEG